MIWRMALPGPLVGHIFERNLRGEWLDWNANGPPADQGHPTEPHPEVGLYSLPTSRVMGSNVSEVLFACHEAYEVASEYFPVF